MLQGLRLQALNAGHSGLIPGQESNIPHAAGCHQKVEKIYIYFKKRSKIGIVSTYFMAW